MSKIVVAGGKRLSGEIKVSGSKNAALPILFAAITTRGVTRIDGLPDIIDVSVALRILEILGADIKREGNSVIIDSRILTYVKIPTELTASLRASTYLIGACLARFHFVSLSEYGGCSFGNRPIDMHIGAAMALGAKCVNGELSASELEAASIRFDKISVGATVNAIIMCASANGESKIYGFAREPHVFALIDFLNLSGAKITVYDDYISVIGGRLGSSYSRIIPDMIEAGTYLALSLATDSNLNVSGADRFELKSFSDLLTSLGVRFDSGVGYMRAEGSVSRFGELVTGPYPGFPTDLQPVLAPLFAVSSGGRITERVWSERFSYLGELSKFGVGYERAPNEALILPSRISSSSAVCTDLRGGAALLIAALIAKGESVIDRSELIARGYENITEKLSSVGARIKEIN